MIYQIINHVAGRPDYIIPDESAITTATNTWTCNSITIGLEADATALLETNRLSFLDQQSYRFTIAKELVDGNNTTWMAADFDSDPVDTIYQVFNQYTGQHEKIQGTTNALARREEIKTQFVTEVGLDNWNIVDKLPEIQFVTTSTNTDPE